jgi:hypothetical protein
VDRLHRQQLPPHQLSILIPKMTMLVRPSIDELITNELNERNGRGKRRRLRRGEGRRKRITGDVRTRRGEGPRGIAGEGKRTLQEGQPESSNAIFLWPELSINVIIGEKPLGKRLLLPHPSSNKGLPTMMSLPQEVCRYLKAEMPQIGLKVAIAVAVRIVSSHESLNASYVAYTEYV